MFNCIILFITLALVSQSIVANELHDPTLPGNLPTANVVNQANPESEIRLSATWISSEGSRATINGESYHVGQILSDGHRLVKISPHYVIVKQNGVSQKIDLVPSIKNSGR